MALILKDRVLETSQTSGTGTIALSGAANGFQTFSSAIGNTNTTYYAIVDDADSQWEVGLGTVGAGTLTRDTVYSSSNGGSKVNFGTSIKNVFCDYPASKAVYKDGAGAIVGLGTIATQDANNVSITGGTVSGTTLTSDTVSNNLTFTSVSAPSYVEGELWYDSTQKALTYYNDVNNNQVHIGQEVQLKVINNTGSSIANGTPVYVTSTSSGQSYPNIALAQANAANTSAVLGLTNGTIASGAVGYVCTAGLLTPCNTGSFSVGQVLYLSPYSAGQLMNTVPPTGYAVQVGVVAYANTPNGSIYVKQTTPLAVSASTIVGQVAVANGGTGASTLTGYVKGSGTTALTASSTIPNTDISGLGTMSTQNASSVAITGGTIDNTVIGGTTPAAGTFTTITGQTEVLKGTGQNLILRSQNFGTTWTNASVTITANSTTAPDATNTASTIAASSTGTNRRVWQGFTSYSGLTYTASFYAKPLTTSWVYIQISDNTANANGYYFDVTNGVVGTNTGLSAGTGVTLVSSSITSAGNGWYRCSVTVSLSVSASFSTNNGVVDANSSATATSGASAYFWGAQVEVGTTANTYIPTTTTAIYGTPTLSFSGVAGLGLQSDGSLYVSPAGTGALQAQATTSSTVGGNARGANAVDWQTARTAASQVASAANSVIGGGTSNTVTGGGGSGVFTGNANSAGGVVSFVGTGLSNAASGYGSVIVGGYSNTAAGYWNFIGSGYTNSGTSGSAVTTQSGTMNATTAVTLSGSNASIKVGQLITGTSITSFPPTYVAAISGTSLTLSQVASGSSTSTLSFYTPHGIVVGGGNNQATGSYSFIGGGGDAGTAANRNVASGDWSVVGGGTKNVASGAGSVIAGGGLEFNTNFGNTASGTSSFIGGGILNTASANGSVISGGWQNTTNGSLSTVVGGRFGTTRGITGNTVFAASNVPISGGGLGFSQAALLILGKETTNATATVITSDGSGASGTNQVILPNNSAYYFKGAVIAGVTGAGDTKGWSIEGVIKRGAGVGTTALVGTPTVTSLYADAGAATWAVTATADTTNGGLKITVTGQASTTIRWVCELDTTEMTY